MMLNAGMPITRVLQNVQKRGRFGRVIAHLGDEVKQGQSLSDAVEIHKRKLAKLDVALIKVGEHTGQLAEIFNHLSEWYDFCQRIKRAMFNGALLPLIYIHMAAIVVPVPKWAFSGWDGSVYWIGFFRVLAILYVPALILLAIFKLTPKEGVFRRILDRVLVFIPFLGKTIREIELGRYCKVFSITYRAGIPIVQCSEIAMDAVVNLVIKDCLKNAHEQVKVGNEMSMGFGSGLPAEFKELWEVGEESGDLDETSWRLGNMHAENAENRIKIMSKVVPLAFYFIIMGIMVYYIFKGYAMIYGGISL
ncbi:MAG: type II secretion system F family protein [Planctomycetota bacterium]